MYVPLIIVLSVLLFGADVARADEELSRQELFTAVRLSTPGETLTSLPAKFSFPEHARDNSVFGIDVSHHNIDGCNCTLDWADVASHKVQFVYVKASQGTGYADPTFVKNASGARDEGKLAVGGYHFLTTDGDVGKQADNFVSQLNKAGELSLLPSLDLEWDLGPMTDKCPSDAVVILQSGKRCDKWSTMSSAEILAKASAWVAAVSKATGRPVLLYTSGAWWTARVGKAVLPSALGAKEVWVADYSKSGLATEVPRSPGKADWSAWQFSDSAKVYSGKKLFKLDASILSGDLARLQGK